MVPFESLDKVSYSPFIVKVCLISCVVTYVKHDELSANWPCILDHHD